MFEIARTNELLNSAIEQLNFHENELTKAPDSFVVQLMVKSATSRVKELTRRLVELKTLREFELIELRLVGADAQDGSLPMYMIGQLSNSFEETLVEIGKYAKHGIKKKKGVFLETRKQLGAKLKRLGVGSTRMFVSINTNPDMFGNSLSEVCISRTFEVLSANSSDDLLEKAEIVGKPALRTINKFLRSLLEFNLEVDLNWQTPLDTELVWNGTKQKIKGLHQNLNYINELEPIELNIEGELITQSLKGDGRFELVTANDITIAGTVPYYVLSDFVQVRIGSFCKFKVLQTVIENTQTGKTKSFYELREIQFIANKEIKTNQQYKLLESNIINLNPQPLYRK